MASVQLPTVDASGFIHGSGCEPLSRRRPIHEVASRQSRKSITPPETLVAPPPTPVTTTSAPDVCEGPASQTTQLQHQMRRKSRPAPIQASLHPPPKSINPRTSDATLKDIINCYAGSQRSISLRSTSLRSPSSTHPPSKPPSPLLPSVDVGPWSISTNQNALSRNFSDSMQSNRYVSADSQSRYVSDSVLSNRSFFFSNPSRDVSDSVRSGRSFLVDIDEDDVSPTGYTDAICPPDTPPLPSLPEYEYDNHYRQPLAPLPLNITTPNRPLRGRRKRGQNSATGAPTVSFFNTSPTRTLVSNATPRTISPGPPVPPPKTPPSTASTSATSTSIPRKSVPIPRTGPLSLFPPTTPRHISAYPSISRDYYRNTESPGSPVLLSSSPETPKSFDRFALQGVSVFEDDEEKVGLMDYLRWRGRKGSERSSTREKGCPVRGRPEKRRGWGVVCGCFGKG